MVMKMIEMISLEDYMKETYKLDNICVFLFYLMIILLLVYLRTYLF